MALSQREFYWTWWSISFPHAWAAARHISTAVTILGGAAVYIWPTLDATRARLAWGIPLLILVAITLYRLAIGAYDLHVANTNRPALRLARMKELLVEMAEYYRSITDNDDMNARAADVWHLYKLLEDGCSYAIKEEYHKVSMAEPDRWRGREKYNHNVFTADYLLKLSQRLTAADIDYGFTTPNSYAHFRAANTWPENERPISSSELPTR
jgi:hypothetical protein